MPFRWVQPLQDGSPEAHLVHLYRDDRALVRTVGTWTAHALARGGAAVLIGTPEHRDALAQALSSTPLDLAGLEASGRLVQLEAEACMARFMRDGKPDRAAFHAMVREVFGPLRGTGPDRPVRAWGEMVNLLVQRGDPRSAMALEELWNEAVQEHGFRLLCSYEGDPFEAALYEAHRLQVVAHGHGQLLAAEHGELLDQAVEMAMHQVCGAQAGPLRELLAERPVEGLDLAMSPGQRMLTAMNHVLPDYGRKLTACAGAHYRAAAGP